MIILKGRYDPEDYLNGFLVVRTITDTEFSDGSTKEKQLKYNVLYDPENKYEGGKPLGESGWKIIGTSKESFDIPPFDDDRFYLYFEEGEIK